MRPLQTDLSVYSQLKLEKQPVAINYCLHKPEGIEKLDKQLGFCEMVKEAQQRGTPFYFTREDENCIGKFFLGMRDDIPRSNDGGMLGVKLEIFQDGRANARHRTFVPHFDTGMVNYVVYSPLDKLRFEPDVLVILATPRQGETIMRAMIYSTGELFESRGTLVGNCASLYIYPYLSGKVNYMVTGMSYGMNGRRVYPDGMMLISIPYQWISTITQNLKEMKLVPHGYEIPTRDEFVEWDAKITQENAEESKNPQLS